LLPFHARLICWKTLHATIGYLDVSCKATYIQGVYQASRNEDGMMSLLLNALIFSATALAGMGFLAWLAYGCNEGK
jgi:hypothetical protein